MWLPAYRTIRTNLLYFFGKNFLSDFYLQFSSKKKKDNAIKVPNKEEI